MKFSKHKKLWIFLILLSIITGCRNPFSPEETSITGLIRDADENGIKGVLISISPGSKKTTTDASGSYTINDVRPGSYTIKAKKDGFSERSVDVTVESTVGFSCYDPDEVKAATINLGTGSSDSEPPTVSSTYPASDEKNIPVNRNITATFNEPMDASSISKATFSLYKYDSSNNIISIEGNVSYDASNKMAVFDPYGNSDSSLPVNTKFTAELTQSIQDESGNRMSAEKKWNFWTVTK